MSGMNALSMLGSPSAPPTSSSASSAAANQAAMAQLAATMSMPGMSGMDPASLMAAGLTPEALASSGLFGGQLIDWFIDWLSRFWWNAGSDGDVCGWHASTAVDFDSDNVDAECRAEVVDEQGNRRARW